MLSFGTSLASASMSRHSLFTIYLLILLATVLTNVVNGYRAPENSMSYLVMTDEPSEQNEVVGLKEVIITHQ